VKSAGIVIVTKPRRATCPTVGNVGSVGFGHDYDPSRISPVSRWSIILWNLRRTVAVPTADHYQRNENGWSGDGYRTFSGLTAGEESTFKASQTRHSMEPSFSRRLPRRR